MRRQHNVILLLLDVLIEEKYKLLSTKIKFIYDYEAD